MRSRTPRASIPTAARRRIRRACSPGRGRRSARTGASTTSAAGQAGVRLSTAFDSVTLYGEDPAERPDVYGKVGNSGVSVATLDDAKRLYSGFDLCEPSTSVSMTINGPGADHPRLLPQCRDRPAGREHLPQTDQWEAADAVAISVRASRPTRRAAGDERRARHSASSASPVRASSTPTPTGGSAPRRCGGCAEPCRRTSSRRTRRRTRASSRPSSRFD